VPRRGSGAARTIPSTISSARSSSQAAERNWWVGRLWQSMQSMVRQAPACAGAAAAPLGWKRWREPSARVTSTAPIRSRLASAW